ncbi:MAG: chromosomal replication initiator protein DnaA [Holosporales bacterium]|nr:chromosomal replication initiator protein DnaA [Holosporales bacterium]
MAGGLSEGDMEQIWTEIQNEIKEAIGATSFNSWFSRLTFLSIDNNTACLNAPSNFIKDTVLTRYASVILDAFKSHGTDIRNLSISIDERLGIRLDEQLEESRSDFSTDRPVEHPPASSQDDISNLDKRFTFQNFVVGKPNEFAYAAAKRAAEVGDTLQFNPLFLYGGVGLGKTHLMHAIAWHIKKNNPRKKVIYISAEKFMYMFINSLRSKSSMSFKELFRNVDVLMIDDVQFIGGKESTQEEFFHTFNELVDNNRLIVLSADKSPSDLDALEERLKSRLGWGLVADIHPTTYELRLGILQSKAKRLSVAVANEVLEFLACKITSNIRELEGALNRLVAHATLVGIEISIDIAQEVLKDLLRSNEKFITIDVIQRKVCEYFGVKLSDMKSAKRHKNISKARHTAMYLAKQLTTKSLPEIGKNFGDRDHATVIHAVKKVKGMMAEDREFSADLEILAKVLES